MAGLEPAITGMGEFYVRRLDHSAKLLCYSETSTFAYIKCCIHFTEVCSFLTVKRERKIVLNFNEDQHQDPEFPSLIVLEFVLDIKNH